MTSGNESETTRLEALWAGGFGDEYVDRNATAYAGRQSFWDGFLAEHPVERALEVGCNVGGNLRWLAQHVPPAQVFGIDVNEKALDELRREVPGVNGLTAPARTLPLRSDWFDLVFTFGVLIHQPDDSLADVMSEMVRCSRRWVLCGEYYAEQTEEVPYRGHAGALFRRDYASLFLSGHPELELVQQGFLGRDEGWDDITWWLFEKPSARKA